LEQIGAEDDLEAAVDEFLRLLQKSTPDKKDWLNEGRRAVFHQVARAALNAGILQLLFLKVAGYRAAALFNFAYRDRIWVYNSGLDPENFAHLSAGVVLSALTIEKAIQQSYKTFDFLRGSEQYKYRFGAQDTTVHRINIRKPG